MRTTIDLADDVLFAAKEVASRERVSMGEVLSRWGRQALLAPATAPEAGVQRAGKGAAATRRQQARLGIQILPARGGIATNELVNRIRDEEGV
jgi:hypothetical protein